jgi:hypothetical protein
MTASWFEHYNKTYTTHEELPSHSAVGRECLHSLLEIKERTVKDETRFRMPLLDSLLHTREQPVEEIWPKHL